MHHTHLVGQQCLQQWSAVPGEGAVLRLQRAQQVQQPLGWVLGGGVCVCVCVCVGGLGEGMGWEWGGVAWEWGEVCDGGWSGVWSGVCVCVWGGGRGMEDMSCGRRWSVGIRRPSNTP